MEALEKEREPLTHLEAVYIMLPTEQVNGWMNEWLDGWMNGWLDE